MKVAVIGIGGRIGTRLAAELLSRGHTITGIERTPGKATPQRGVTIKQGDARQSATLAALIEGHDAVLSASRFETSDATALIAAVKNAGVPRLLLVGGAGSLEVAAGGALADQPDFPEPYKPEAEAGRRFLDTLRKERDLNWTFLSLSAEFAPGKRTGEFRVGGDQLLIDSKGKSWISMEDFAIALVDELENPKHSRQRFTVGY